jgi:hypothetical protein
MTIYVVRKNTIGSNTDSWIVAYSQSKSLLEKWLTDLGLSKEIGIPHGDISPLWVNYEHWYRIDVLSGIEINESQS